jgi:hypothetical protein
MNIAGMVPSHMTLKPDENTVVRSASGRPVAGTIVLGPRGLATSPANGPAIFDFPVVLPKTARVTGCRIALKGNGPLEIRVGRKTLKKLAANKAQKATLEADALPAGSDFIIPELPFSDFCRLDLRVLVAAAKTRPAALQFSARIDYLLPVESASDYLNYIMTQA